MVKIGQQRRAFHAAGHAVAAVACGLSVDSISLPADDTAGATYERAILSAAADPAAQVEGLRIDIIVTLAGFAAQMRLRPAKRNFVECADDLKLAQAWASWAAFIANVMSIAEFTIDGKIELSDEEQAYADQLLKQCQERADQIVAERWDDIVTVADALLDRAVLNAEDIDALLRA
jgi:hypothetical protein